MRRKNYPLYEVESVNNLSALIKFSAEKYGDKPAFTFERKNVISSISYCRFEWEINALGTAMFDLGIQNMKVAVIGENSYEWILTYFAVVNSGNVIVPLDRELPAGDIKNILEDSGAEVFVYSNDFVDIAAYTQVHASSIKHYINMDNLSTLIEQGNTLIQQGEKRIVEYIVNSRALSAILYTSGTTGAAKGVMLSHQALACNTAAVCEYVEVAGSTMLVLPLHHAYGFLAAVCVPLFQGKEIFINSSLKNMLADLKKYKPCTMFLVPLFVETFYNKIWNGVKEQGRGKLLKKLIPISNMLLVIGIDIRGLLFKSVHQALGGSLKLLVCGGAPLDVKYVKRMRDFGINVLNGYGITECSPVVSVNRNHDYRDGSVGQPLRCCEVKILAMDETGHGEVCVRGDTVTLGYYNNEQATKEAFDGEWFKTGDIGFSDNNGFLFIIGRKKNLIILNNGKNVYPEEVEMALLNIPYIKEAIVYAKDNMITAEVFLDTENEPNCASCLDSDIIKINRMLPSYKNIGRIVIRDTEFMKTTTKKIKRQIY